MTNNLARLEALIYVTGDDGISSEKIMKIIDVAPKQFNELTKQLKAKYENDSSSAFELLIFDDRYRLVTKPIFDADINQLFEANHDALLTPAALETVTMIAYNQPVTRIEVDEIRGVNSSAIIQKLLKQDLIKTHGRKNVPGEPYLYVTTARFLNLFGLSDLNQLPPMEKPKDEQEEENE